MPPRRRKPRGATTRDGWGHAHQRRRASLAPSANAGKATCCRCHQPIHAGEDWHLDRSEDRTSYIGVSHASCNLAAGADKVRGQRHATKSRGDYPLRWSRRWFDDAPLGTINLDGGQNPEIYLGNGDWQPFADAESLDDG